MLASIRPVRSLLIAIFVMMAGSGFLSTLIGLRLEREGSGTMVIGLVATAYFGGLVIGALRAGGVVRGVGHIRSFAAFVALLSASTLSYALVQQPLLWGALRLVDGVCVAGVFVCLESWLNDQADPARRGATLAFYMMALYGGQAVSQALLGLEPGNPRLPFVVASLVLSLTVIPVALTRMAGPVIGELPTLAFRRLYTVSPLGLVGATMTGIMLGAFYGMAAVHAQRIGLSNLAIASFMGMVIAGGIALQWPLGRLSDRFDRRKVIVVSLAATAAICAAMAVTRSEAALGLLGVLFGGFAFALYPLCVAHTNDHLEAHERTGASGGLTLSYSIGAAVGPLASAFIMMLAGPGGLYGFIGLVALAACLFGLWRQIAAAPVPNEDQGMFHMLPRTTPMAATLEPETTDEDGAVKA